MVSSKEISEMLQARREGKHPERDEETLAKKCPQCGVGNKEDAKFCVSCGKNFEEKAVELKPENIKEEKDTKICPSCNSEIPQDAKFCVVCGETQVITEETEPAPKVEEIKEPPKEDKEIEPSKTEELSFKLIVNELIFDEEGLQLNKNIEIEGLNGTDPINYDKIEDIQLKEETGIIEIVTVDKNIKIKGVDPDSAQKLVSKVQEMLKEAEPEVGPESMDKIQKAKELMEIGAISEEEFENIKMKILQKN